jgi:hypothetical protein
MPARTFLSNSLTHARFLSHLAQLPVLAIGVGVGLKSLAAEGPPIERFQLRPILFIVAAS